MTDTKQSPIPLSDWLHERRTNCLRLAKSLPPKDKAGWLEDAGYFDQALAVEAKITALEAANQTLREERDRNLRFFENEQGNHRQSIKAWEQCEADLKSAQDALRKIQTIAENRPYYMPMQDVKALVDAALNPKQIPPAAERLILSPDEARAADDGAKVVPPAAETPAHNYISTACHHDQHDACRKTCKFCAAKCCCQCHQAETPAPERERKLREALQRLQNSAADCIADNVLIGAKYVFQVADAALAECAAHLKSTEGQ